MIFSFALTMVTAVSSETLIYINQTAKHYIPEDRTSYIFYIPRTYPLRFKPAISNAVMVSTCSSMQLIIREQV